MRISIGGGGTDLPSYYRERGGMVISAAIDKYVYVTVNRTFMADYCLKYSSIERVDHIDQIQHPLLREAMRLHDAGPYLELVSIADVPSGTGLGSSGTFCVGVLRALYALKREHVTAQRLAEEACHIEIDILGEPVGKQDQYIAAFGGLTVFDFNRDHSVNVNPLAIDGSAMHELEERLLLFFTGYSRAASLILSDQKAKSEAGNASMLANLDRTKELGYEIKTALEGRDIDQFGKLMHEHWLSKRTRSEGMSNNRIDECYEIALKNGAVGGKLVGAGAGGFLLLLADDPARLRLALGAAGLSEVRFTFDLDGATVLTRG